MIIELIDGQIGVLFRQTEKQTTKYGRNFIVAVAAAAKRNVPFSILSLR